MGQLSEVFTSLNEQRQDANIAGGTKSRHLIREREIYRPLDLVDVVEWLIPGSRRFMLFSPRTFCNGFDHHCADILGPADGDRFLGMPSVFWIRHLNKIQWK